MATQDGLSGAQLDNGTLDRPVSGLAQANQSDAQALYRACRDYDYSVKVTNNVIHITDRKIVDNLPVSFEVVCPSPNGPGGYMGSGLNDWKFSESPAYADATAVSYDPTTGGTVTGTAEDPQENGIGPTHTNNDTGPQPETQPQDTIDFDPNIGG